MHLLTMIYRPEINGLRTVALLPVILHHCGFQIFRGGFVGVDIFFVISGYLITSIIIEEKKSGNFSIYNFYCRRIRRILPALYLVLISSSIFAIFMLSPFDARDFWQSALATVVFATNFLFVIESSDYFGLASQFKPLLHTWSLAVEEQFYLIYPIFILFVWRFGFKKLVIFLVAVAVVSFGAAQWTAYNIPAFGFFLLPTRAWELLIGAFIAFYFYKNGFNSNGKVNNRFIYELCGAFGLVIVGLSMFLFEDTTPYPSYLTLLPTVGAGLVILFANSQTLVGKLLGLQFMVGIGLLSYSAYLWHQPLLVFARYYFLSDLSTYQSISIIAITFAFAGISWKYVEQPCRKLNIISNKALFSTIGTITLILVIISLFGHKTKGFQELKLSLQSEEKRGYFVDFFSEIILKEKLINEVINKKSVEFKDDSKRNVLILGDSMSGDFMCAVSINPILNNKNKFIRQDLDVKSIQAFLVFLKQPHKRIGNSDNSSNEFFKIANLIAESDEIVLAANCTNSTIVFALNLAEFLAEYKKVYLVEPFSIFHLSSSSYYFCKSSLPLGELNRFMFQRLSSDYLSVRVLLSDYFNQHSNSQIILINKSRYFCNFENETCNLYTEKRRPMIFDEMHLTVEGVKYFGECLANAGYFSRSNSN